MINQVNSLISTDCFCPVYNIMNSKILEIDAHVQKFAIISDTSISKFFIERFLKRIINGLYLWNMRFQQ